MLKRHVDIIQANMTTLAKNTNVSELVPKLISNKVFTEEMVERILGANEENFKLQATSLYSNVSRRGPQAFVRLVAALFDSNHNELGKMLLNSDASASNHRDSPDSTRSQNHICHMPHANPFQFPDYMDRGVMDGIRAVDSMPGDLINFNSEKRFTNVEVRHSRSFEDSGNQLPECYKMTSNPRGYALIINNIIFDDLHPRNGAENDERAMKELLEKMYFIVDLHKNKTREQMQNIVEAFAAKPTWQSVDCACIVLMSHGDEGDSEEDTEILGTDGLGFKTRDVISYFYNDSCPMLIKKPKIFIFQSCRGKLTDEGVKFDLYSLPMGSNLRTETDGRAIRRPVRDRQRSDMFIAHPVPPGIKANRDKFSGAWFIQIIVEVFAEYAWTQDLENLFKIVDFRIKNMYNLLEPNYQTVTTKSIGWNKRLFFNPGLHLSGDGEVIHANSSATDVGMDVVDTPAESQQSSQDKEDKMRLSDDGHSQSGCLPCHPF